MPHDELRISITCPACGHELEETLARLENDPIVICRCGVSIDARGFDSTPAGSDRLDTGLHGAGAKPKAPPKKRAPNPIGAFPLGPRTPRPARSSRMRR